MSRQSPLPPAPPVSPPDPHFSDTFEQRLAETLAQAASVSALAPRLENEVAAIVEAHTRKLDLELERARKAVPRESTNAARRFEAAAERVEEQILRLRQPAPPPPAASAPQTAEDPTARLAAVEESLQQMESDLASLRNHANQAAKDAREWERRARLAIFAGDDKLALEAMRRRREQIFQLRFLEREATASAASVAVMRQTVDELHKATGDPPLHDEAASNQR